MLSIDALITQCAPDVGYSTMAAIIKVESGGYPWAIGDNTMRQAVKPAPRNYAEAVWLAKQLIARGHSIDMGLAQVNSRNLPKLGLSVEEVMEPCTNIRTGAYIVKGFYADAVRKYGYGERALLHALSGYNTGSLYNGAPYVQRILVAARNGVTFNQFADKRNTGSDISPEWQQFLASTTTPNSRSSAGGKQVITHANSSILVSKNDRPGWLVF